MRYLYSHHYIQINKIHKEGSFLCCKKLHYACTNKKISLFYEPRIRHIYLELFDDISGIMLRFCPWCGKKIPKELNDEYATALSKYINIEKITTPLLFNVDIFPEEFQSDEWWRKRKL